MTPQKDTWFDSLRGEERPFHNAEESSPRRQPETWFDRLPKVCLRPFQGVILLVWGAGILFVVALVVALVVFIAAGPLFFDSGPECTNYNCGP